MLASWFADLLNRVAFFKNWSRMVATTAQAKMGFTKQQKTNNDDDDDEANKQHLTNTMLLEPTSFWLSAFFFPQGFLTAVLQNYARKYQVAVDTLSFRYDLQPLLTSSSDICVAGGESTQTKASTVSSSKITRSAFGIHSSPLPDGVRIFGLYLDSARLSHDKLTLCDCDVSSRFFAMPEIHFVPTQDQQNWSDNQFYQCPLYRTSSRAGALSSSGHSTNFVTTVNVSTNVPVDHWILRGTALLCQLDD